MTFYLSYLKDILGNNYIGINIPNSILSPFLNELSEIIGEDDYDKYTQNQQTRDHGNYHITVINVMEYNSLSKKMGMDKFINSLQSAFEYEVDDVKMMGVGTATRNSNRAYFVVVQSDKLDAIRTRYELPKQDFHATLGFSPKDTFGVPKNKILAKKSKFIKFLKVDYYKNDNWNFLKRIGNFDLGQDSEIIPVYISDDKIKIKCDKYYMDISLNDSESFWIMTKYPVDKDNDMPRLSETEISKIMNKE